DSPRASLARYHPPGGTRNVPVHTRIPPARGAKRRGQYPHPHAVRAVVSERDPVADRPGPDTPAVPGAADRHLPADRGRAANYPSMIMPPSTTRPWPVIMSLSFRREDHRRAGHPRIESRQTRIPAVDQMKVVGTHDLPYRTRTPTHTRSTYEYGYQYVYGASGARDTHFLTNSYV